MALKANKLLKLADQTLSGKQQEPGRGPDTVLLYDGTEPAEGLILTNPEMMAKGPVESYPTRRTVMLTQNVINQFAVAYNLRYLPRTIEPRESGHLFVFDVMSALNTSLGRAFPAGPSGVWRPGSLAEIWKWLNETALLRGWRVVEGKSLLDAMARGLPIIAMSVTPRGPRLAVVEPGQPGPGGKPRLASGYDPRGQQQAPEQLFGSSPVRYLAHE